MSRIASLREATLARVLVAYELGHGIARDALALQHRKLLLGKVVDDLLALHHAPDDPARVRAFAAHLATSMSTALLAESCLAQEASARGVALAPATDARAARLAHEARVVLGVSLSTPAAQASAGSEAVALLRAGGLDPFAAPTSASTPAELAQAADDRAWRERLARREAMLTEGARAGEAKRRRASKT